MWARLDPSNRYGYPHQGLWESIFSLTVEIRIPSTISTLVVGNVFTLCNNNNQFVSDMNSTHHSQPPNVFGQNPITYLDQPLHALRPGKINRCSIMNKAVWFLKYCIINQCKYFSKPFFVTAKQWLGWNFFNAQYQQKWWFDFVTILIMVWTMYLGVFWKNNIGPAVWCCHHWISRIGYTDTAFITTLTLH